MGIMEQQPGYQALVDQYLKGNAALGYGPNGVKSTMQANPFSAPTMQQSTASAPVMSTSNQFTGALDNSTNRLNSLLDNPDSINQSAAYKFRVGQGMEALQRSLGAKGMLNSGNRLLDLTKYGQDMGSQEYDAQFGRLKGLYDTNTQAWLGDKNANTSQYNAQSANWLGDRNANTNAYNAQANAFNNYFNTSTRNNSALMGGNKSTGGVASPWSYNLGGIGGNQSIDWGQVEASSPWGQINSNGSY